jgi:hypothetical protein
MVIVRPQPPGRKYDIIAVPAETPLTEPLASTVATAVLLLLQVPPAVVSFS